MTRKTSDARRDSLVGIVNRKDSVMATVSEIARSPKGPMQLYLVRLSPTCRVVWMYLLQHQVSHVLVDVDFSTSDAPPEAFKRLPHKDVPVLVDGDMIIFEAPAILRYVGSVYTNFAGFGISAQSRMLCESLLSWTNAELHRIVGYCYSYPQFLNNYQLPSPEGNEALIEYGMRQLSKHLEHIENDYLDKNRYLTGERITIADIFVATVLVQAEWSGFKFHLWPRVENWLRRVKSHDGWVEAHVAHNQLIAELEKGPLVDD